MVGTRRPVATVSEFGLEVEAEYRVRGSGGG